MKVTSYTTQGAPQSFGQENDIRVFGRYNPAVDQSIRHNGSNQPNMLSSVIQNRGGVVDSNPCTNSTIVSDVGKAMLSSPLTYINRPAPSPPIFALNSEYYQPKFSRPWNYDPAIPQPRIIFRRPWEIDHFLPEHKVINDEKSEDKSKIFDPPLCSICMEVINNKQPKHTIATLPCAHTFHTDCIDTWLNIKRSCPLCKTQVNSLYILPTPPLNNKKRSLLNKFQALCDYFHSIASDIQLVRQIRNDILNGSTPNLDYYLPHGYEYFEQEQGDWVILEQSIFDVAVDDQSISSYQHESEPSITSTNAPHPIILSRQSQIPISYPLFFLSFLFLFLFNCVSGYVGINDDRHMLTQYLYDLVYYDITVSYIPCLFGETELKNVSDIYYQFLYAHHPYDEPLTSQCDTIKHTKFLRKMALKFHPDRCQHTNASVVFGKLHHLLDTCYIEACYYKNIDQNMPDYIAHKAQEQRIKTQKRWAEENGFEYTYQYNPNDTNDDAHLYNCSNTSTFKTWQQMFETIRFPFTPYNYTTNEAECDYSNIPESEQKKPKPEFDATITFDLHYIKINCSFLGSGESLGSFVCPCTAQFILTNWYDYFFLFFVLSIPYFYFYYSFLYLKRRFFLYPILIYNFYFIIFYTFWLFIIFNYQTYDYGLLYSYMDDPFLFMSVCTESMLAWLYQYIDFIFPYIHHVFSTFYHPAAAFSFTHEPVFISFYYFGHLFLHYYVEYLVTFINFCAVTPIYAWYNFLSNYYVYIHWFFGATCLLIITRNWHSNINKTSDYKRKDRIHGKPSYMHWVNDLDVTYTHINDTDVPGVIIDEMSHYIATYFGDKSNIGFILKPQDTSIRYELNGWQIGTHFYHYECANTQVIEENEHYIIYTYEIFQLPTLHYFYLFLLSWYNTFTFQHAITFMFFNFLFDYLRTPAQIFQEGGVYYTKIYCTSLYYLFSFITQPFASYTDYWSFDVYNSFYTIHQLPKFLIQHVANNVFKIQNGEIIATQILVQLGRLFTDDTQLNPNKYHYNEIISNHLLFRSHARDILHDIWKQNHIQNQNTAPRIVCHNKIITAKLKHGAWFKSTYQHLCTYTIACNSRHIYECTDGFVHQVMRCKNPGVVYPKLCLSDAINGLIGRQLKENPPPDHDALNDLLNFSAFFYNQCFPNNAIITKITFNQWWDGLRAVQRSILFKPLQRLRQNNFLFYKNLRTKAFTKFEPLGIANDICAKIETAINNFTKPPRVITGMSPEYNLILGPEISTISKIVGTLFNYKSPKSCYIDQQANAYTINLTYASGMDRLDIGRWLKRSVDFGHVNFYKTDYSRMDSHVLTEHLYIEGSFWNSIIGNNDQFSKLLQTQWATVGQFSFKGDKKHEHIQYGVSGTRRSGDQTTSVGNSILNCMFQLYVLSKQFDVWDLLKTNQLAIIFLGDDTIISTAPTIIIDDKMYIHDMLAIGMEVDLFSLPIENLTFCSSVFIPCEVMVNQQWMSTYYLTPLPHRIVTRTFNCKDKTYDDLHYHKWAYEVAGARLLDVQLLPAYANWFRNVRSSIERDYGHNPKFHKTKISIDYTSHYINSTRLTLRATDATKLWWNLRYGVLNYNHYMDFDSIHQAQGYVVRDLNNFDPWTLVDEHIRDVDEQPRDIGNYRNNYGCPRTNYNYNLSYPLKPMLFTNDKHLHIDVSTLSFNCVNRYTYLGQHELLQLSGLLNRLQPPPNDANDDTKSQCSTHSTTPSTSSKSSSSSDSSSDGKYTATDKFNRTHNYVNAINRNYSKMGKPSTNLNTHIYKTMNNFSKKQTTMRNAKRKSTIKQNKQRGGEVKIRNPNTKIQKQRKHPIISSTLSSPVDLNAPIKITEPKLPHNRPIKPPLSPSKSLSKIVSDNSLNLNDYTAPTSPIFDNNKSQLYANFLSASDLQFKHTGDPPQHSS